MRKALLICVNELNLNKAEENMYVDENSTGHKYLL